MSSPLDLNSIPSELIQKLFLRINITDDPNECWEWTAGKSRGYGRTSILHKYLGTAIVHRSIKMLELGVFFEPHTELICHHCDNPSCCNPKHLYVGTNSSNQYDSYERGLQSISRPNPRFIWCEAMDIRSEIASSEDCISIAIARISARENVSIQTVEKVWLKQGAYKDIK